ncbi:alpha/beta hydrolase [Paraglaciecola sp.]|uniref:alpha/beta hydrolase n=1 Tax=Paraglaciecola sp. TaxID=1920173 RepID=UPI003EF3664D
MRCEQSIWHLKLPLFILVFLITGLAQANDKQYVTQSDIAYYDEATTRSNEYLKSRCKLDIYYPKNTQSFATVVWFHGGGLTGGGKHFPKGLLEQDIAIISVNYRLYPKVKAPVYIQDSAAAVAWVFQNIESYGGDKNKIFLSGHSAGGYLASMVGLDKSYLAAHQIDANQLAGLIPFSGHTITHFTVRKERGIEGTQAVVDNLAPLYHVRKDAPPLLLITGDRELELLGRYEENAYMMRMMRVDGHKDTRIMELDGYGHGIIQPAVPLLLNEVKRLSSKIE